MRHRQHEATTTREAPWRATSSFAGGYGSLKRSGGARLGVGFLAALITAVAMLPLFVAPAGAATAASRAAEFNLAGWKQNRGDLAPARTVTSRVKNANPRPLVVSLSEVCSSNSSVAPGQWEHVVSKLAPLGYAMSYAPSVTNRIGSRCDRFGNGLAVLGRLESSATLTYTAQEQTSSLTELRNLVCAVATTSIGKVVGCSTHLVPRLATARTQAAEARAFVEERFSALARVVGGDFNLKPDDIGLDTWYERYREADASQRGPQAQATLDSGAKVDYVFADQLHAAPATSAAVTPVDSSDHHWYDGSLTLTAT